MNPEPGGPGRIIRRGFGMGPFAQILGLATGRRGRWQGRSDPNGPDLVTAMREQLGLKLDGRSWRSS